MCANELQAHRQCEAIARWQKNNLLFNCTRGIGIKFAERRGWMWAPYLVCANIAAYLQVDLQPDASTRARDCNPLQKPTYQLRNPSSHMLLGTGWGYWLTAEEWSFEVAWPLARSTLGRSRRQRRRLLGLESKLAPKLRSICNELTQRMTKSTTGGDRI